MEFKGQTRIELLISRYVAVYKVGNCASIVTTIKDVLISGVDLRVGLLLRMVLIIK